MTLTRPDTLVEVIISEGPFRSFGTLDTWYIVSKERHEGLSWWHRQVEGLSEPQRIQGQPGQFIETLSQSKRKKNPVR